MKKFIAAATLGAALLVGAQSANAGVIQVGLQAAGVNSGNITLVNMAVVDPTGNYLHGNFDWPAGTDYGTFHTHGGALDSEFIPLPNILQSQSIDVASHGAGTLTIYVASNNLTELQGPATSWATSFSASAVTGGSVTMSVYLDKNNEFLASGASTVPSAAVLLSSHTYTGGGFNLDYATTDIAGPYSIFEVYTITSTATNQFYNLTISEQATVPTPTPLALLGLGLAGLGFLSRRRLTGAKAA